MRALLYLIGLILIALAVVYLLVPADSLPAFLPGHEAGLLRPRMKHGYVAGAAGVVLFIIAWVLGRRR
jgi:hypothetical protein